MNLFQNVNFMNLIKNGIYEFFKIHDNNNLKNRKVSYLVLRE